MQARKAQQAGSKLFKTFQIIRRRKEPLSGEVSVIFFFKCHIYRDYGPVLWAGRTLVFIIKWPSNTESAALVPVPALDDGHDFTRPCRPESFRNGFDAFFRRSVTRLPQKTTTPHSSASSITSSPLLWNLCSSVDNPHILQAVLLSSCFRPSLAPSCVYPAWILSQCSQKCQIKENVIYFHLIFPTRSLNIIRIR